MLHTPPLILLIVLLPLSLDQIKLQSILQSSQIKDVLAFFQGSPHHQVRNQIYDRFDRLILTYF